MASAGPAALRAHHAWVASSPAKRLRVGDSVSGQPPSVPDPHLLPSSERHFKLSSLYCSICGSAFTISVSVPLLLVCMFDHAPISSCTVLCTTSWHRRSLHIILLYVYFEATTNIALLVYFAAGLFAAFRYIFSIHGEPASARSHNGLDVLQLTLFCFFILHRYILWQHRTSAWLFHLRFRLWPARFSGLASPLLQFEIESASRAP
jgi:hypothetical protein